MVALYEGYKNICMELKTNAMRKYDRKE